MHASSRHGTPSLTSLPKDGGVSCISRSSGRSPIQFLTVHSHASTSVKLMEQAGPLGHSPRCVSPTCGLENILMVYQAYILSEASLRTKVWPKIKAY